MQTKNVLWPIRSQFPVFLKIKSVLHSEIALGPSRRWFDFQVSINRCRRFTSLSHEVHSSGTSILGWVRSMRWRTGSAACAWQCLVKSSNGWFIIAGLPRYILYHASKSTSNTACTAILQISGFVGPKKMNFHKDYSNMSSMAPVIFRFPAFRSISGGCYILGKSSVSHWQEQLQTAKAQ